MWLADRISAVCTGSQAPSQCTGTITLVGPGERLQLVRLPRALVRGPGKPTTGEAIMEARSDLRMHVQEH